MHRVDLITDVPFWDAARGDASRIRSLAEYLAPRTALRVVFLSMRGQGAGHIAFGWPHLWWLEHYAGLHHHLRSRYRCVVESDRLVVFELSGGGG